MSEVGARAGGGTVGIIGAGAMAVIEYCRSLIRQAPKLA
jgi:hypothetical protein